MNWKKILFSMFMVVSLTLTPSLSMAAASEGNDFSDVPKDSVHYEAIMHLVESGSITGFEDNTFRPYNNISRQHVAVILTRELDLPIPDNVETVLKAYKDVDKHHMYAKEIAAVTKEGIFGGNNKKFMPEEQITREQLATVLYQGFELDQYDGDKDNIDRINLGNVDDSHKEAVQAFGDLDLTTQLDDFRPVENLKRAQFASFLNNVVLFIGNENATIPEKMDEIVTNELPIGTVNGISIRDAETGESVYSHFGKKQLRPASNMKLLTAAAALETLGTDYQFSTEVLTDGSLTDTTLNGNLYLKGKGDPTLLKEDLDEFAAALKDKGIEEINGDIIGDDTWYDDVKFPVDMPWSDESGYYGAPISALTMSPNDDYDTGTVIVEVNPGDGIGDAAEVSTDPVTDNVTIVNRAETVDKEASNSISVERKHGSNEIVVEGNIPLEGDTSRSWSTVWNPTAYTLDVFKKSLEERGIAVREDAEVVKGEAPEDTELLVSSDSMPLEDILVPFLKLSNNGFGEILTKEMGRTEYGEGTWDNGLKVIQDTMDNLGLQTNAIYLRDGSGISDKTFIPAEEISRLLYAAQGKDWFPAYENALPVAGNADRLVGGTLSNRLTEEPAKGNVIAKTGSLTGVSTLSGYVTTKDGDKLVFSILNNNFNSTPMTEIQDQIALMLAEHEENRKVKN